MTVRLVLYLSLALAAVFVLQEMTTDGPLYPDVWGFWTFGRYALTHPPATIYDNAALQAYQAGLGMPAENGFYPYPYPPWFLLAVAPLGWLPYPAAALVWRGVTFAALVAVGAWRWQWNRALLLVVAPACALSFVVGQNGFLTAALMLGGLRLLPVRPVLAGALLAATAYKPQLALLVPVFLVFGAHWRALAGAVLGAALLTVATVLLFGWAIWPAWADAMQAQALALAAGRGPKLDQMPTVTAAIQLLGGSAGLARAGAGHGGGGRADGPVACAARGGGNHIAAGDVRDDALRIRLRPAGADRRRSCRDGWPQVAGIAADCAGTVPTGAAVWRGGGVAAVRRCAVAPRDAAWTGLGGPG